MDRALEILIMLIQTGNTLSTPNGAAQSPDWNMLKEQLEAHLPNLLSKVLHALRRRSHYRKDIAQMIRDAAGVPEGTIVGVPAGEIVGLTNFGALSPREQTKIWYAGDLSSEATSGLGTEIDPWVIENRHFGHAQVRLDNTGWTKFRNCLFEDGDNMEFFVQANFIGDLIFENCEFSDALGSGADAYVVRFDAAREYRFYNCLFGGAAVNQAVGTISNTMNDGDTLKVSFINCRCDESKLAWSNSADFFENIGVPDKQISIELEIRHCEFSSPSGGGKYIVVPVRDDIYTKLILENNQINGFGGLLRNALDESSAEIYNLSVRYNNVIDTKNECIRVGRIKGGDIAYNNFIHDTVGTDNRLVYLTWDSSIVGAVCEDVDVHHNKFTKKTGTATASNECLESAAGVNISFRWNWVTECPEDAFEHLFPQVGCTMEYLVADNCGVQVCDIWKTFDPINYAAINSDNDNSALPAAGTHIHHIYGDCGDWPVILSGANGVIVHDIYVDSSSADPARGSVNIQLRDNVACENIFVSGPLPRADERGIPSAVINTSPSVNVAAQWVDENGYLITL